jgi:hypothetical protein
MALKWFDASEAEKFGQSLAQFFINKIPLGANLTAGEMSRQLASVDQMYLQIDQFRQNNKLNIYKKAKLGSVFKYELIAAGYKPELVDQVTKGVLLKL